MIVLTDEPGEAEKLAEGAPTLQRLHRMPIDPRPYPRPASSEPACLAFVAARLFAPLAADALLRRLRVRVMLGGLLDDPSLIATAARDAGLEVSDLTRWSASAEATAALAEDKRAARNPSAAAREHDGKLGGPPDARRYTSPSYEIVDPATGGSASVPGFNPARAYEEAIEGLAAVDRRPPPGSAGEVLRWAGEPLATAEVAAVMGLGYPQAREQLAAVARPEPAGADFYWA